MNEEYNHICYKLFEKEQQINRYSKKYIQRNLKNTSDFISYQKEHGKNDIREINKKDIIQYFNYLKTRPNQKRPGTLALDTVEGIISSLNIFYSTLYRNMIIKENPFHCLQLDIHRSKNWKKKTINNI